MPRLNNDACFSMTALVGQRIAELLAATECADLESVQMLFLRLDGDESWHRLFLDASIGFWEMCSRDEAFCDFEGVPFANLADRWKITGTRIESAECVGSWDDEIASRFEIRTEVGTLVATSKDEIYMTVSFHHHEVSRQG